MRRRFSPSAVASSDGAHIRIKHDRRANTTGRTEYEFCGRPVIITNNSVYATDTGKWIGHLRTDDYGNKYVYGSLSKGCIMKN